MKKKPYYIPTFLFFFLAFMATLTVDSFSQWKKVTNLPASVGSTYWLDIYFLETDARFGWVCGRDGKTIRTTDGGQTWQASVVGFPAQLESIDFADRFVGYTSGQGFIYKSTDGGVTWFDVSPPDNNQELWGNFFITPDIGVVVGGGCGSEQGFYRTTDGGASWREFHAGAPSSGLTDVILYDANGLGYATSSGIIWITRDGGKSWNIFSNSGPHDWQEELAHSGNTFLVPYSPPCTGGEPGGMRITVDNGKNWSQYYTGRAMFGSFLHDDKRGWVCGWDKAIYYTSDAGRNWLLRNCGIEKNDSLDDLWFINDTLGWVVGDGVYKYEQIVRIVPVISANGPVAFCEGDSVILSVLQDYKYYRWSTGETSKSILVRKAGNYSVRTWNTECDTATSNSIAVSINPSPKPLLTSTRPRFCVGDSVMLSLSDAGQYKTFSWSTGQSEPSVWVNQSGTYTVTVTNGNGCPGTSSITVEAVPNPEPKITLIGSGTPCVGDSVLLWAGDGYKDYEWYQSLSPTPVQKGGSRYYAKESGSYYVVVFNDLGCQGQSPPILVELRNDTNRIMITVDLSEGAFKYDSAYPRQVVCRNVTIENVGNIPVNIDNALLMLNQAFSVPQSQFSISLVPGESRELAVCYSPTMLGMQTDTLVLSDICWPHRLILRAFGKPDDYLGNTRCNVPVRLVTKEIHSDYIISVYAPFPNPAVQTIEVPYDRIFTGADDNTEECLMYNSFGEISARPLRRIDSQLLKQNKTYESGGFVFDVRDLRQGAYFIVVNPGGDRKAFPVIISR